MELGKDDFFGQRALLNDEPHPSTVTATEPTWLITIDRHNYTEIVLAFQMKQLNKQVKFYRELPLFADVKEEDLYKLAAKT
jgi:CRP-like cAMP-binding protein